MVEELTAELFKKIKEELPDTAKISDIRFEGAEIVLYTKSKEFFTGDSALIKKLVSKFKKRIMLRPDPSLCKDMEEAKKQITKIVPKEAGVKEILFEPEFGTVTIEAEKPGLVIGKGGETLREVKKAILWAPIVRRAPLIPSDVIKTLRDMLYRESAFRKDFLDKVGRRIHSGWKATEWLTMTALGGFREVGRSCILLRTPESRVLLDCGIKPGTNEYPYLNVPEADIHKLDAVVLSHTHMDHCLPPETPILMVDGRAKPLKDVREGDKLLSLNFETGKFEIGRCAGVTRTTGHRLVKRISTKYHTVEASPNHRFFTVEGLNIVEKEVQQLAKDDFLLTNLLSMPDEAGGEEVRLETNISYDPRRKDVVKLPELLTEQLAAIVGYIAGDGHKTRGRIRITDAYINLLAHYRDFVKEVFGFESNIRHHPDRSKRAWCLEINNVKILRFLEANFPEVLRPSLQREVPPAILKARRTIKAAFLQGVFDAEGCVTGKPVARIELSNHNQRLLSQCRQLLIELGIPASLSEKQKKVYISSGYGIASFQALVSFGSERKRRGLEKIGSQAWFEENNLLPITGEDLRRIIVEAGLMGRIHNSPRFREELSLYDWLRRNPKSCCTRKTARHLLALLEARIKELVELEGQLDSNLKAVRQRLSIPLEVVAQQTGLTRMKVQWREQGRVKDKLCALVRSCIEQKICQVLAATRENASKIQRLLALPVMWERITDIQTISNPYESLIDIEVLPHRNFIANGVIVHNSAMIPYLYEYGCKAPLYATAPTRDLMVLMALDFLKIAQREGKPAPYTSKGIKEAVRHCITLDWEEVTDITPDMRLTLLNNGHILGGSLVHIHVGEGFHNVLYSGDIKFDRTALFDPASTNFARAETVITESTYGLPSDIQPRRPQAEANLINMVKRTIERGGKVLIPSFAVERSQDVQVILARSKLECPIYLDGMVWDVSAIHTAYPEYLSRELQKEILQRGWNPFTQPIFKRIGSEDERKKVVESKEPCVIISTSGMLIGGPVLWWLRNLAEDKKNTLAFVGYQAEGTLGRKILRGWREIPMEEKGRNIAVPINLEVAQVEGLSGHSDFKQLLNFIRKIRHGPERVIVNHGDPAKCVEFARQAHRFFRVETLAPKLLETIRLR